MRGKVAFAAAVLGLGALLSPAGAVAKSDGGYSGGKAMHGGGKHSGKHGGHAHKHGHKSGHKHAHKHGRGFLNGLYWDYPYAASAVYVVGKTGRSEEAPPPAPPRLVEWKIYQVGTYGGCQSDVVGVPASHGNAAVTVIRC